MNLHQDPFLTIGAPWAPMPQTKVRYPSANALVPTYDLRTVSHLGGVIGLNPEAPLSAGTVTFRWTSDAAGEHIVGTQGIPLTSGIVSMNELRLPNRGPFLYLTYQPFQGVNLLSANLFGTNVPCRLPQWPGDTLLFTEYGRPLAPTLPGQGETLYPDDYFAGECFVFFDAWDQQTGKKVAGPCVTFHAADLTNVWYQFGAAPIGQTRIVAPIGSWSAMIHNPTDAAIAYALTVTPKVA